MRNAHIINNGKSKASPKYVVYMDSESRVDEKTLIHTPYLICATFARYGKKLFRQEKNYIGNENIISFWLDVCDFTKAKTTCEVYAHNMGYDAVVTKAIPALESRGFRLMSFFEKGGTFIYKFVSRETFQNEDGDEEENTAMRKTVYLLSSTNFYAQKLAKIGETFGVEKIDIHKEYEEDYNTIPVEQALIYCRQDVLIVEIAMKAMFDFVNTEDLGVVGKTAASQAFNAFRFRFMKEEIYVHDSDRSCELERKAYYGGRVECWQIGHIKNDDFYYCDVNSMYPYVMRNLKFPTKLLFYSISNTLDDIAEALAYGDGVIAHVKIKTDRPYFPLRDNNKLIFPIGEYETYLASYELEFAINHNLITEVYECSFYEMHEIFKEFVDYFYNRRLEAAAINDEVHKYLFKLLMNCLYGKFGQLSEDWERVGDYETGVARMENVIDEDGEIKEYKILAGSIFEKKAVEESFNSFPAIAAHVTSAARMHLLKHILIAGWDNILYMDTDSLFCNSAGHENLMPYLDEHELGKMKIENKGRELIINAPKDYKFFGEVELLEKRKGISKDARQLTNNEFDQYLIDQKKKLTKKQYAELIETVKKDELTVNMQWPKMSSHIRTGKVDEFQNVLRIKKLTRKYNKGNVAKNGKVTPFIYPIQK